MLVNIVEGSSAADIQSLVHLILTRVIYRKILLPSVSRLEFEKVQKVGGQKDLLMKSKNWGYKKCLGNIEFL
jgi:hypothetical protein